MQRLTLALLILTTSAHAADLSPVRKNLPLQPVHAPAPLLQSESSAHKSPPSPKLAFLMSLAVPGLGQFYTGSPKLAGVFLGVEALTWISWAGWRSKGNDLKADFRAFADQHWNESRYREWQTYNRTHGSPYNETETLPCKEPGADCEKVDTQQYYEMIGKYDQFVFGWSDVTEDVSVINTRVDSDLREDYENQRNESNKYLKRASVVIGLSVLNRVVSAIHASAHARSLNQDLSPRRFWIDLSPVNARGGAAPSFSVNARF